MNMRNLKIAGMAALGLALALAIGWLWGAAGRWPAERRLAETALRLRLTDARSRVLGGRVDLYSLNFGAASQNFEAARQIVTSTSEILAAADAKDQRLDGLRSALDDLAASQRFAAQMRQDAHTPAGRAARAISAAAHAQP